MQYLIFKYRDENRFNDIRSIELDGEIWFLALDVCRQLDIQNVPREIASLDEDEKLLYEIRIAGQIRKANFVNESGLYALVFKSKKPTAKEFRKWVTKEVLPTIRKTGTYSSGINRLETPNFVIRYNENFGKTEKGYFSVISELYVRLYAKFEHLGYKIPNKSEHGIEIRPDNSVGRFFSEYLQKYHPSVCKDFKEYSHYFPNINKSFPCRQYKNEVLHLFIKFVDDVWIPQHAERYFRERDLKALDYLPKLLKAS